MSLAKLSETNRTNLKTESNALLSIQCTQLYKIVELLKTKKLIKAAPTFSVHVGTIIRELQPVLRYNYKSCSTVRVGTDVVSIMAACRHNTDHVTDAR